MDEMDEMKSGGDEVIALYFHIHKHESVSVAKLILFKFNKQ